MYLKREDDISGHVIIIDPEIHKKAKLTRKNFLERVGNVKEIRTLINYNYISFYICSFEEYNNLRKFHELINDAKFDFDNYYCFAIGVQPKLYNWFKTTEYTIIEKQIVFWLASLYFFVPEKRGIMKNQLYKPLFEEVLKTVDSNYKGFPLPDFNTLNDEEIFVEEKKCKTKYLKECNNFYYSNPPTFLSSPFDYEHDKNWGVNDRYCFEFIQAYFLEKDWEFIIIKGKNDDMGRAESRSDIWEKWKHTYATFDERKSSVYSFYHPVQDIANQKKAKKHNREIITQNVKDKVWRRDDGKCVGCGSNEKLEFDHIIPVIKGGSSTYRNIQLLCEPCNRKKYSNI
jgi:hypothetical protein